MSCVVHCFFRGKTKKRNMKKRKAGLDDVMESCQRNVTHMCGKWTPSPKLQMCIMKYMIALDLLIIELSLTVDNTFLTRDTADSK